MLKHKFYILATAFAGLAFGACNEIDEADRFEEAPLPALESTVLLEEFTGQNCPNCPEGAKQAAHLHEMFGHKVIVVGIHAGGFSHGSVFQTKAGLAYWNQFYKDGDGIGYPAAMVNRSGHVSTSYQTEWVQMVMNAGLMPPAYSLELNVDYNNENKSITVESTLNKTTELANHKTKLLYLLTESKILDYQLSSGDFFEEYEHNHVLRGAIGDKDEVANYWGEEVTVSATDETKHKSAAYALESDWLPENMHVVGILYDAETYEVLQAAEVALVSAE